MTMTAEEVRAAELLEQRHALLDLDEDSVPFRFGPSDDPEPHCFGFVHHPEGD
jgi:hypothetical protein